MWIMLSSTLLFAALPLITPSLAQDTTNSTCLNQRWIDQLKTGYVNSTGSAQFLWSNTYPNNNVEDPWRLSAYVNDTRNNTIAGRPGTGSDIEVQALLSVPDNIRNVSLCHYQFHPLNATSTGDSPDGSVGCAGVLSNACSMHITEYLRNTSSITGDCSLPIQRDQEAYRNWTDVCGDSTIVLTSRRRDVSQTNCSLPSPSGIEVPNNYVSIQASGLFSPIYFSRYLGEISSEYTYDLAVNQASIFAFVGSFARVDADWQPLSYQTEAQVVCVTPNNISEGSRIPESRTPWTSAGANWQAKWWLSPVVAGMLLIALVL